MTGAVSGAISIEDWARLITLFVSAGALVWGVWSYVEKLRLDHYTEIDRIYADIVKLRITYTHLANPPDSLPRDVKSMDEKELRYDAYAFLIWNFIETIHDRCTKGGKLRKALKLVRRPEGKLLETWKPIMREEGNRHAKWLSSNKGKFKDCFLEWAKDFVDDNGNAQSTAAT